MVVRQGATLLIIVGWSKTQCDYWVSLSVTAWIKISVHVNSQRQSSQRDIYVLICPARTALRPNHGEFRSYLYVIKTDKIGSMDSSECRP